ncbi:MAG: FAD:protein FMN transferase [Syntrophomonadaceae bacterium]|nr:FAD:protein FMN transferase [Bacillota bacterium]
MKLPHWPRRLIIAIVVSQILLVFFIINMVRSGGPLGGPKRLVRTEFLMDTVVETMIYTANSKAGENALSAAFFEAVRLEAILNRHRAGSELKAINLLAGKEPLSVSADTFTNISLALEVGRLTSGAFDLTVAPLLELWGFATGNTVVPSQQELAKVLPLVDYRRVRLTEEGMQVFLENDGMKVDLGGIAKGYIVDKAVEVLQAAGISSGTVDAGGDIRVIGSKPDGSPWRIGIRHPRERRELVAIVDLRDKAIVTSGDYERFFTVGGQRYHHLLDPQTGLPVRGVTSVTIVAPNAFTADAYSTAVFVMGQERGMALVESLPELEAIIITEDGQIHLSSGLEGQVEIL